MLSTYKTLIKLLIASLLLPGLTACELTEDDKENIDTPFIETTPPDEPADTSSKSENCDSERFVQPDSETVKKLDLVFVVDTSGSINAERRGIANGIDAFVQELPVDVDFQVGIMYAHGQESNNAGELTGSPAILSSNDMTIDEIRTNLYSRMDRPRTEHSTDGGEVGMYTFLHSITDKYEENKESGFYRDDAALAVVFVADENAICSLGSYPQGVTPVYDPNKKEYPAFDTYCDGVDPEAIVNRVKQIKGDKPFLISGIIYTGENEFPQSGENEIGYGFLETIELANGIAIDLANGDYDVGMREIGYLTYKKLNLLTEFNLANSGFLVDSLNVKVDTEEVAFNYAEILNQIQIDEADAGGEKSEIVINYCFPADNPATISEFRIFGVSFNQASVSWQTDQDVTTSIKIIKKINGQETVIEDNTSTKEHLHVLTGLSDNTSYTVEVRVRNADGAETVVSQDFKTLSLDDFLF